MSGEKTKLLIAFFLLVTAIIFINIGIMNGEAETVGKKATNICLECIGIG